MLNVFQIMYILMFIGLYVHLIIPCSHWFITIGVASISFFSYTFKSSTNYISFKDWWSYWLHRLCVILINDSHVWIFLLNAFVPYKLFFCSWNALHCILHLLSCIFPWCTCCSSSFDFTFSLCQFLTWTNYFWKFWVIVYNFFVFFASMFLNLFDKPLF